MLENGVRFVRCEIWKWKKARKRVEKR